MSIEQDIEDEFKAAMRARNSELLSILRVVRGALIEESRKGADPLTDERAIRVLGGMHKRALEAAESYKLAGRDDLAEIELYEATIIASFFPTRADSKQTRLWVEGAIAATGASAPKHIGRVMGLLMKEHKGEISPSLARSIAVAQLSRSPEGS